MYPVEMTDAGLSKACLEALLKSRCLAVTSREEVDVSRTGTSFNHTLGFVKRVRSQDRIGSQQTLGPG